ncbi:hypothetical protein GA0070609_5870 [Micromonospora echinaurantiaca]|uniref:Uncharacterized protein n=1 Tax=Micromonospora echinaurantiaca TaxID=47857 RepID=A0A1C5K9V0_9ACTN|nr:hypothetical protein GA0070609_5870 [Micromonospora echinaurantiaca]
MLIELLRAEVRRDELARPLRAGNRPTPLWPRPTAGRR